MSLVLLLRLDQRNAQLTHGGACRAQGISTHFFRALFMQMVPGRKFGRFVQFLSPPLEGVFSFCAVSQLAELKMNHFSYWVRSQPDWWLTFKSEDTTAGWRAAARREDYLQDALTLLGPTDNIENAMDPRGPRYALHVLMAAPVLTEGQIDWVVDELSDFAARRVSWDDVQVSSCSHPFHSA